MPNWVFNTLTVEGNPELVQELKKQVSEPYVMPVESRGDLNFVVNDQKVESEFSFWNIIRPTNMTVYPEQPVRSDLDVNDPNWWADTVRVSKTDDSWYNWNMRNWGCKWDASFVELVVDEENGENWVLVYKFDTPWSPAMPAMLKLSEQYPNLLLTLEYEEEQGWGGEVEMMKGKISAQSEYDEKCWECDAINNMDYCETCEVNVCLTCNKTREEGVCNHVGNSTNV
jgi:hypothetical protein